MALYSISVGSLTSTAGPSLVPSFIFVQLRASTVLKTIRLGYSFMMSFIFILFSFFAFAQPIDSCTQDLTDHFPRTWRIDQKQVDLFLAERPEETNSFLQYSQLAQFVEDEKHEAFFEWLGVQHFLSAAQTEEINLDQKIKTFLSQRNIPISEDPSVLRQSVMNAVNEDIEGFRQVGLENFKHLFDGPFERVLKNYDLDVYNFVFGKPVPQSSLRAFLTVLSLLKANDPEIHASTEDLDGNYELFFSLLDEAKFEKPRPFPALDFKYDQAMLNKLRLFLKTQGYELPEYSTLMKHSRYVQVDAITKITSQSHEFFNEREYDQITEIYKNIVLRNPTFVPQKFKYLINELIDEKNQFVVKYGLPKKSLSNPKKIRELSENFRLSTLRSIYLARLFEGFFTDENGSEIPHDKLITTERLFGILLASAPEEISVDQGLDPLVRKAFVKVFLEKPILSSNDYRTMLRTRLKQIIASKLATVTKSFKLDKDQKVAPSQQNLGPTREERKANYVKIEKTPLQIAEVAAARKIVEMESNSDFLSELLDHPQDLATDRERLLKMIRPGEIIPITLKRFGFVYNVTFSKRALEELTSPSAQLPQDFRPWLKAMSMGPARGRGQNGWKRVRGHEWKIKILTSPYRLHNYRDNKRVWHFTQFQLNH